MLNNSIKVETDTNDSGVYYPSSRYGIDIFHDEVYKSSLNNLNDISLKSDGDDFEIENYDLISLLFPFYEQFWKSFIVPMTNRVLPDAYMLTKNELIKLRLQCNLYDRRLSSLHYSILWHFILGIKSKERKDLYEFYMRLGTSLDLITELCIVIKGYQSKFEGLKRLPNCEDDKKKGYSLKDLFTYFELSDSEVVNLINPYIKTNTTNSYRNFFAHQPKFLQININNTPYIPKMEKVKEYLDWDNSLINSTNFKNVLERDFVRVNKQIKSDLNKFVNLHVLVWPKLIEKMRLIDRSHLIMV